MFLKMKNYFLVLTVIFNLAFTAQSQDQYKILANGCVGDTCESVVIAQSGLKIRTLPSFTSKTIAIVPFESKIKHLVSKQQQNGEPAFMDRDSVQGYWKMAFWQGKKGYVFSGYLGLGILKMNQPFYLFSENNSACWDDAYISLDYNYYGVYPNFDSTSYIIKKCQPIFYNTNEVDGWGGTTFKFKDEKPSLFAFATQEPFLEGQFNISKDKNVIRSWNEDNVSNVKINIPNTNWEVKFKDDNKKGATSYKDPSLIIKDKKTGVWHNLIDDENYVAEAQLAWCGDMDGDGLQDFMLYVTSGKHDGGMILFLSKNAGKWKFVKLVGSYVRGGCC
jgi:hypothetical protein